MYAVISDFAGTIPSQAAFIHVGFNLFFLGETIVKTSRKQRNRGLFIALSFLLSSLFITGCATTGGSSAYLPPPIPEGQGRLFLMTGGINDVNFMIIDDETEDEVYSQTPRMSARSPIAYESGLQSGMPIQIDLDPGTYRIEVNTDIKQSVTIEDVVVKMGEEVYKTVQVGRFQVLFNGGDGFGSQVPFLIMDYNMRTVLGNGMTSPDVRHFVVPVGIYKLRIENSPTGMDEIKHLEVFFNRVTPIAFTAPAGPEEETPGGSEE